MKQKLNFECSLYANADQSPLNKMIIIIICLIDPNQMIFGMFSACDKLLQHYIYIEFYRNSSGTGINNELS